MKIFFALVMCQLCFVSAIWAQNPVFYPSNYPKVLSKNGKDTLANAFTGGISHPIFGNVDINMDGRDDLVIMDRETQSNGTILPFLSIRRGNSYEYAYAPQYTHLFPKMKGWGFFADYDSDGRKDIFAYGEPFGATGSITVFKNIGSNDSVRFQMQKKQIGKYSRSSSRFDKISATMSEIPAFTDIDNDGDLDILTFDPFYNTTIFYYRNVSKDSLWNMDSLKYVLVDQCWGRFLEADTGVLKLNYSCLQNLSYHRGDRKHEGSAISALDIDGDGDKEMFIGDAAYPYLLMAKNDRLPGTGPAKLWDTVGSYINRFPSSKPVKVRDCPLASFVDVNADGRADMLVSPMEIFTRRKDIVWHYKNTGSASQPNFVFSDSSFLENTMLDWGDNSAPCFLDYDGDGKTDMLLSMESEKNGQASEQIFYYRNVAVSSKPVYSLVSEDFLNLSNAFLYFMTPATGDVNNDGKKDLLIGSANGKIFCFLNQVASGYQLPGSGTYLKEDVNGSQVFIDVLDNSAPTVGDLNGDGKADLLIGNKAGNITYYQNIGSGTTPLFKKISDDFAGIGTLREGVPVLGLIDNDDSLDLIIGSQNQTLGFYRNVTASASITKAETKLFSNFSKTGLEAISLNRPTPALVHIDSDNMLDIVVGNSRGGILVYTSMDNPYSLPMAGLIEKSIQNSLQVSLFPNPAKDQLNIVIDAINNSQLVTVLITDMLGRNVRQMQFMSSYGRFEKAINISGLCSGIYSIHISLTGESKCTSLKLLINK